MIFNSILNFESLETLRNVIQLNPKIALNTFQENVEKFSLKTIELDFELNLPNLLIPNSDSNFDLENSYVIGNALSEITPSVARDERLWVTLSFNHFSDYMAERWPSNSTTNDKLLRNFNNHYFGSSSRARWRDQGISRLWWTSYFASRIEGITKREALEVLYSNSELLNSFMGHPRTVNNIRVASSILTLLHLKFLVEKMKFDRQAFRRFMTLLDLRGGKLSMPSIRSSELDAIVEEFFIVSHSS